MEKDKLHIFTKIPSLQTKRLTLRKMAVADAADMFEYASQSKVTEYLLWSPHESPKVTKNYLSYLQTQYAQKNFYDWAVVYRETGKMIGTCGYTSFDMMNNSAEVGYVINPDFWGMGIGPEALFAAVEFGFTELDLHRSEVKVISGNTRSENAAKKCGFRFDGELRDYMLIKGKYRNIKIYSILENDYFSGI